MKTIGQTAYEAYASTTNWMSSHTGDPLPPFQNLNPAAQVAWENAAHAVKQQCIRENMNGLGSNS